VGDKKSARILQELENIDDELDGASVAMVKISDEAMLREYDLDPLPTLVYFRDKFPMIFPGDMTKEVIRTLISHLSFSLVHILIYAGICARLGV
jgi:hypothetical protein